jgi:hypothetical protein
MADLSQHWAGSVVSLRFVTVCIFLSICLLLIYHLGRLSIVLRLSAGSSDIALACTHSYTYIYIYIYIYTYIYIYMYIYIFSH